MRHNPYFNRWFSAIMNMLLIILCPLKVTILILIDGFLQSPDADFEKIIDDLVTILILIDGFLQCRYPSWVSPSYG